MNDGNGGNDENAEDDAVLRGIAGRSDGGMMGREGAMALPKSSSSDEAGSNNDDSDNEGEQQEDAVAS